MAYFKVYEAWCNNSQTSADERMLLVIIPDPYIKPQTATLRNIKLLIPNPSRTPKCPLMEPSCP